MLNQSPYFCLFSGTNPVYPDYILFSLALAMTPDAGRRTLDAGRNTLDAGRRMLGRNNQTNYKF
jgi:hypothetical protein